MLPYTVHGLLEEAAQNRPEVAFVIDAGSSAISYGEIEAGANRLARVLSSHGLSRGERVALIAENSRFYVEAFLAILKAGGIAVPLNTAATPAMLAEVLRTCGARALVASPRFERPSLAALAEHTEVETLLVRDDARARERLPEGVRSAGLDAAAAAEPDTPPRVRLTDLDVAAIIFTSGSTGTPQGATLSHLNLLSNARSIVSYLGLDSRDRVLAILPFYYVYGQSLLTTHLMAGGSLVIENRFMYPNVALDTLEGERCTGLSGVPSTFAILLNRSNLSERALTDLRYVTQAGGAMSPELTRRLMKVLPGKQIFIMYGATEASARLSYLAPEDLPRKVGSIGKAIPNVELRVLRADGAEADVGEVGEIVATGSNIMSGYWGDPEGTSEVLDEHGYHTGDLARRDEEGFLFIVGRKKDFIKAGAHRISAKEIEEAILESPEVHEAAVIGVPDEILGEKVRAYVVPRDGVRLEASSLERSLKERLPPYKVPAEIVLREDLPKNESGKIMKQALREDPRPA